MHPYVTEGYRETVRAIHQIGQDSILQRFKAIANKEEFPNDILTQIVKAAGSDKSIDIEDLVDDFATFYVPGKTFTYHCQKSTLQYITCRIKVNT